MTKKRMKGQEAVEFILITVLVFFGALFVMIVFGEKIASFFQTDSSVAKVANNTIAVINPNSPGQFNSDYDTKAVNDDNKKLYDEYQDEIASNTEPVEKNTIAGYDVTLNTDGSASFTVGTQKVDLSAEIVNLQDIVLETSGSAGLEDLVSEVAYMIETHKDEYAGSDVPFEVVYGKGSRTYSKDGDTVYSGNASAVANSYAIKVGDHMVVKQNDQYCSTRGSSGCAYEGYYRIEGNVNSSGTFSGDVTSNVNTYGKTSGTYTANVDATNGLIFNKGKYKHYDNYYTDSPCLYDWNLTFDK